MVGLLDRTLSGVAWGTHHQPSPATASGQYSPGGNGSAQNIHSQVMILHLVSCNEVREEWTMFMVITFKIYIRLIDSTNQVKTHEHA